MSAAQASCMAAILLPIVMAVVGCDEKHPQAVDTPPPVVLVARPVERTVTDYQVFTARTQAVESVDLKARVTGYLTKVLFKDGDLVKAGDVLFQIDDRPYKGALDQAKAAVEQADAAFKEAKATLEVATAALTKAQAEYDIGLAVQKKDRSAISQQEITRRLGARDEAKGSIDRATASIGRATASIGVAKAGLEIAQLNFDWCKVTAPVSGRTTRHLVDVGNVVSQNVTTLTNIVSLKPVWAYINVDQTTVRRVQTLVREGKLKSPREGEIAVAMGVGVGSDQSFPIPGVVDYISNQLDPNTGTIQVRSVFSNADESLVAGLFARVRVPISAAHPALLVTDRAIGTDQGQKFVLVVNDKSEVEYRAVGVGQIHDGLREVLASRTITETDAEGKTVTKQVEVLKPTDWIIVTGLQRVQPGVKVEPKHVDLQTLLGESGGEKKSSSSTAPK
jgi:RND family efflux transporter MFP subunit